MLIRAQNAFLRGQSVLKKSANVMSKIRPYSDAVGSFAQYAPVPGAGAVRLATKGFAMVDNAVQKLAKI